MNRQNNYSGSNIHVDEPKGPLAPWPRLTLIEGKFLSNEDLAAMTDHIQELEDRVAQLEAQLSGITGELEPSPVERPRPRTDELRADRQTVLKHRDSGNI